MIWKLESPTHVTVYQSDRTSPSQLRNFTSMFQGTTALCLGDVKRTKLSIPDITSMSTTPLPGGSPRYLLEKNIESSNIFSLQGAPAEKLTVGMPTFGHGWELMDENEVSSWHSKWKRPGICHFFRMVCFAWLQPTAPKGRTLANWASLATTRFYRLLTTTREQKSQFFNDITQFGFIKGFVLLFRLPWLPGATPKSWETVVDGCYLAPYITNGPWSVSWTKKREAQWYSYKWKRGALQVGWIRWCWFHSTEGPVCQQQGLGRLNGLVRTNISFLFMK